MPIAINHTTYMTFAELVDLNINTEQSIKKKITLNEFKSIKSPVDKRKVLVAYDSLPDKYKTVIIDTIGDPVSICQSQELNLERELADSLIKTNDISEYWIIDTDEYRALSDMDIWDHTDETTGIKISNIAKAAAICKWYNTLKPTAAKKLGYASKPELLKAIQAHPIVEKLDGFWVASDRFGRKFSDYKKHGVTALLSRKSGNQNNVKLKTEGQKQLIKRLYASHKNRDFVWIADEYNVVARVNEWPELSESAVRNFLSHGDENLHGLTMRNGTKAFKSDGAPVNHRQRPTHPGYLWEGDGTPWELYYQYAKKNAKGKEQTYYWGRKVVYMVTDGYNDLPLGWAIGETENVKLIVAAWKNAILNTGMLPWQIRVDNYARKTMGAIYEQIAKYFTPAQVGNARTKMIEHVFGQFSATRILKSYNNWSGCNITNRTESNQPNREFLDKEKKEFPDEMGVIHQINESINTYRNSIIKKSGLNRFEDWVEKLRVTEKLRIATHETLIDVFGTYRSRTYSFDNEGITMTVDGDKMHFMDFGNPDQKGEDLPELTQQYKELFGAKDLRVKYLPEDLNMIRVDNPRTGKKYYLPVEIKTPGCIMDAKEYPEKQEALYQKLRFEKHLIGSIIDSHEEMMQVTNGLLSNMSVDAQGIMKTMFTVDGSNKQYLNEAKAYMKALDKRIDDKPLDPDIYDDEVSTEVVTAYNEDIDLYD